MPSSLGLPLLLVLMLVAVSLLAGVAATGSQRTAAAAVMAAAPAKRYLCPKCGTSYAAPGVCAMCGTALVEEGSAAAKALQDPSRKKVAFLVFAGAEVIDFTGPYEMFGAAGCDVYTVGATKDAVTTSMGLTVIPKYSFADAPPPDVLVVPGGGIGSASHDEATLRYIRDVTAHDTHTMSVCNGAFILASAGLLDGLSATTTYHNIPKLESQYPKIKVVRDQRYVDNGRIITTGGLSAGMDGALHVISKLYSPGYAQDVALAEEYEWKPNGGFARGALADHQIPSIQMDEVGKWDLVRTEGDTNRWDIVESGHSDLAAPDLMGRIEQALEKGKWTKVGSTSAGPATRASSWRFTGTDGKPWKGTLKIESKGSSGHEYIAALAIARAG